MTSSATKTPTTTRSRKTTKPATSKTPKAKAPTPKSPIPEVVSTTPAAPKPVVVSESVASVSAPQLKKQELLAKVMARSGLAKREAKPVVEAMLDILGEALDEGRDLNLNPMGKVMIKKTKPVSGGTVLTARVRLRDKTLPEHDV